MAHEPIEIAIAISLYAYNVNIIARAQALWDHFQGDCPDMHELAEILQTRGQYWATELPYPTAKVYIEQAWARYGDEARRRSLANEG